MQLVYFENYVKVNLGKLEEDCSKELKCQGIEMCDIKLKNNGELNWCYSIEDCNEGFSGSLETTVSDNSGEPGPTESDNNNSGKSTDNGNNNIQENQDQPKVEIIIIIQENWTNRK